jgi:hypothetical protein
MKKIEIYKGFEIVKEYISFGFLKKGDYYSGYNPNLPSLINSTLRYTDLKSVKEEIDEKF